jgi:NADH-quinone oxidoreductase subunit A
VTPLVAILLLFLAVGAGFIFVHLVAGKLIRPNKPDSEKKTIYECGEPTIGSAWIQFDLRFYVVALLFVIFDVEVAFFFPWAVVFGKANDVRVAEKPTTAEEMKAYGRLLNELTPPFPENALARQRNANPTAAPDSKEFVQAFENTKREAAGFAWFAFGEILIFFGVLLVGFAYLWKRGDLAWVRSTLAERPAEAVVAKSTEKELVGAGTKG